MSDYPTDFWFSLINSVFFRHFGNQINFYVDDFIIALMMYKKLAHVINLLSPTNVFCDTYVITASF